MVEHDYKASCLKRIELKEYAEAVESGHRPQVGDVVAVKITEKKGTYHELDLPGGELVELEEGDIVLGTFGNRSGVKGYIGEVPEKVDQGDKIDFIGSGGVFGDCLSAAKDLGEPCEAEFLGYVSQDDEILNMKDYGIKRVGEIEKEPRLIGVVSTRMDAGKTTLATKIIENLSKEFEVGSLKLTGSARERDRVNMYEAGSKVSLDFVDAGLPSTVDDPEIVISAAKGLINHAWSDELDFIVIEFGAGLISNYHIQDVLRDLDIKESIFSICGVSLDVTGAYGLKEILDDLGYELSFMSGPITDTTAGKDTVEDYVGVPALNAFSEEEMEEAREILKTNFEEFTAPRPSS